MRVLRLIIYDVFHLTNRRLEMDKTDVEYLRDCLTKTLKGGMPGGDVWYVSSDTMLTVACILAGECYLSSADDAIRFFEKPWHFQSDMQEIVDEYTSAEKLEGSEISAIAAVKVL